MQHFYIQPLAYDDIPLLEGMPPAEWHLDIVRFFRMHYGRSYFSAVAAWQGTQLAGVGMLVVNGASAWLGNIITREGFRGQGIGYAVTEALCAFGKRLGCVSMQLIATEMGRPVYEKLGFRAVENYLFTKGGEQRAAPDESCIAPLENAPWAAVLALDQAAVGEDRSAILEAFAAGGRAWMEENRLRGFYLPQFGDGLIIADSEAAGIGLLRYKHYDRPGLTANLPEANTNALRYLQSIGYETVRVAPRMFLGVDNVRRPEMIYSRIGGYLG